MPVDNVREQHVFQRSRGSISAWEPKPECTKGWPHKQVQERPAHKGFGPLLHGDTTSDLGYMAITLTVAFAVLGDTMEWGWGLGRALQERWKRLAV